MPFFQQNTITKYKTDCTEKKRNMKIKGKEKRLNHRLLYMKTSEKFYFEIEEH